MPRSVKDVVKEYERISLPRLDDPPPRRALRVSPRAKTIPSPTPLAIHPLLRAKRPTRSPLNENTYVSPKPIADVPTDAAPEAPVTTSPSPMTTPTRHDAPISLSDSNYSPASSSSLTSRLSPSPVLSQSVSSSSTVVNEIPVVPTPEADHRPHHKLTKPPRAHYIDIPEPIDGLQGLPPSDQPIPTEHVFGKDALPLALPALDDFLAQLPAPVFTPVSSTSPPPAKPAKSKGDTPRMFLPMQELTKGRTLADMFYNSQVPPNWRNRNSIFGFLTSLVLGVAGSSIASSLYSLSGIFDAVQVFDLILSTIVPGAGKDVKSTWKKLFLGTIPNIIALNFFPLLEQKVLYFSLFVVLSLALMYYFHRATHTMIYDEQNTEGLYRPPKTSSGWPLVIVSFTLCLLYLPVSTIAVHGLVWSSDFWPTQNLNATDPTDTMGIPVCYTTATSTSEANLAPLIIPLCIATVLCITIYFPLRLRSAVMRCLPSVDAYTELGKKRSSVELEHEYQRRLARDRSPFSYLYSDYRRQWGTYKSMYLLAKLSALLIVALFDPSNCMLINTPERTVMILRQTVLISVTLGFLTLQTLVGPFIDPVSNASEWTSRAGYVATSVLGLGGVFGVGAKAVLQGPVLYVVYVFTYGLNVYFAVIHWSWVQRLVKRISQRIDFSIDIFSPRLDISANSPHIRRRIWQETLSTLLFTSPYTRNPSKQKVSFVEAPDAEWPPYLLNFQGSSGERHIENVKILREIGEAKYTAAVLRTQDRDMMTLFQRICEELVGPDAFWAGMDENRPISSQWGNLWCIPFPPTAVIRFDDGKEVALHTMREFQALISQNFSKYALFTRNVRRSLRALEGQHVYWPYTHTQPIGPSRSALCCGTRCNAVSSTYHEFAHLRIKRRGKLVFTGSINFASGFEVTLEYTKKLSIPGSEIGLTLEGLLTPRLASFLALNERTIRARLPSLFSELRRYRRMLNTEAMTKRATLSYSFLDYAYEHPTSPPDLLEEVSDFERDTTGKVIHMLQTAYKDRCLTSVDERMRVVTRSPVTAWWYLFWDDFWRRNHATVKSLVVHAPDFDPWYPTSIAYRPLPRAALDAFLIQRGLLKVSTGSFFQRSGILYHGMLNRIYFRLNQIAFGGHSSKTIQTFSGHDTNPWELALVQAPGLDGVHPREATQGTGGGTDHDDESIRQRPHYLYEEVFLKHRGKWKGKFLVWFGLTPFGPIIEEHSHDLTFDLRLDTKHHKYIHI